MDKAKTLEVLRGMKFMQRKEEAKRRALYEVQNKAEVERRLREHTAQASSGAQPQSATVIYDTSFPTEMYSLARRRFVANDGDESDVVVGQPIVTEENGACEARQGEHVASVPATTSSTTAAEVPWDDTSSSDAEEEEDNDVADPSAPPPAERFYVQAGIRAPKLPKRLRETMAGRTADAPHRQKQRKEGKGRKMEQAQQTRTATATAAALKQASRTMSVSEDSFEAMRSAALSMFKQRTKDLTKVAEMQSQVEQQRQQLTQLQATSAELQSVQAALEAHVEQQESRVHSREATLKEVHNALVQLSEEQRLFQRVQQSTEKVTNLVHRSVSQTVGPESVLMQLLVRARDVLAGRSATDFRHVAAELRHRGTVVQEAVHALQRTCRTPEQFLTQQSTTSLLRQMQEWAKGAWEKHAELAVVRELMTQMTQTASAALSNTSVVSTCDTLFSTITPDALFTFAVEDVVSATRQVDALLAESAQQQTTWRDEDEALQRRLEAVGLCCEVLDKSALNSLHEQWVAFHHNYHVWRREWAECEAAAKACADSETDVAQAEAEVQKAEAALTESAETAAQTHKEEMTRLQDELHNCTEGMAHAQRTWAAQHRALCATQANTAQLQAETNELRGRCNEAEAAMARDTEDHTAACAALTQEEATLTAELTTLQETQAALQCSIDADETSTAWVQTQMEQLREQSVVTDEAAAERMAWLREMLQHSMADAQKEEEEDNDEVLRLGKALWAVLMTSDEANTKDGDDDAWLAKTELPELQALLHALTTTSPSASAEEGTATHEGEDTTSPLTCLARDVRRALNLIPSEEANALRQALKTTAEQLQRDYAEHQSQMDSMHKETTMLQAILSDAP